MTVRRRPLLLSVGLALGLTQPRARGARPVTFAMQVSPDVAQIIVALQEGYWQEFNLEVQVLVCESGRQALDTLLKGQADFAAMADFPAAYGIVRDRKFAILADISRCNAQRVIASRQRIALRSLGDLEGRKVATSFGTTAEFATGVMLAEGGVASRIVDIGPAEIVAALARGDVDAAVMFPWLYERAKKTLGEDYREIGIKGYTSHFLVATRPEVLLSHGISVVVLLDGLQRADAYIRAQPRSAREAILRAMGPSALRPEALVELWKELDYEVRLDEDLVALLQREAIWLADRKIGDRRSALQRNEIRSFIAIEPLRAIARGNVRIAI